MAHVRVQVHQYEPDLRFSPEMDRSHVRCYPPDLQVHPQKQTQRVHVGIWDILGP